MKQITVQEGQTLYDIALQEYGSTAWAVMEILISDNSAKLPYGVSTVLAAGLVLDIRESIDTENKSIKEYFSGILINSSYIGEATSIEIAPEGEVEISGEIEIPIGLRSMRAIFLNCWYKEAGEWFCGQLRILHNDTAVDYSWSYDSFGTESELCFETYFDSDTIVLKILCAQWVLFYYEIVTPRFN